MWVELSPEEARYLACLAGRHIRAYRQQGVEADAVGPLRDVYVPAWEALQPACEWGPRGRHAQRRARRAEVAAYRAADPVLPERHRHDVLVAVAGGCPVGILDFGEVSGQFRGARRWWCRGPVGGGDAGGVGEHVDLVVVGGAGE